MEDTTLRTCKLKSSKTGETIEVVLDSRGARIGVSLVPFGNGIFWDVVEVGEVVRA